MQRPTIMPIEHQAVKEALIKFRIEMKEFPSCKIKSTSESMRCRKEGNEIFALMRDASAVIETWKLYARSIALAPNNSQELALGYGNRSALLKRLHKYKDCIQDIDRALELPCSESLKAKLLCRKFECLAVLGPSIEANALRKAAKEFLEKSSIHSSIKKGFIKNLDTTVVSTSAPKGRDKRPQKYRLPAFTPQKEAPCASNSVAIKYNDGYGRHIVATRKIEVGETISNETACIDFLYSHGMYTHCSHCLKASWSAIPCERCVYAMYCSEECRSEAWSKYHDIECSLIDCKWDIDERYIEHIPAMVRMAIFAVRDAGGINQLRHELEEIEESKDPRTKGFTKDGVFLSHKYRSIYSLKNSIGMVNIQNIVAMAESAATTLYYLAVHSNMFGEKLVPDTAVLAKNPNVVFIGALLMHHYYLLTLNTYSFEEEIGSELNYISLNSSIIGGGFFPFSCLLNHSCNPNVSRCITKDNTMITYAIHPIKEGEELTFNYVETFATASKYERNTILLENYFFCCDCIACTENWPSLDYIQPIKVSSMQLLPHQKRELSTALNKCNKIANGYIFKKHIDPTKLISDITSCITDILKYANHPSREIIELVTFFQRTMSLIHSPRLYIPGYCY